jgi:hypothetical protein
MSGYMVVVATRVMRMPIGDFVVIRGADVVRAWHEGVRLLSRLRRRPAATTS